MSSAIPNPSFGAVALGRAEIVASWKMRISVHYNHPMLIIQSCAESDEHGQTPAASITLTGRDGLIALRSAINEALGEGGAA